ncbi:MAG: ATPase domain-containing protein, partial [Acidobacteriota bacterium]
MRLSTGIPGLDDILHGGLAKGFLYLIEGNPGAGKTTLALQFLLEGARQGESGLYISLAESEGELRHVAEPHGFVLDHVTIAKISPPELSTAAGQYTVFQPAEVELADVLETILARVREVNPSRVVIDSMSELRMLARDSLRYRRQILSLKQFFEGRDCTTLLLDERFRENPESQVQTIAHGAISLVVLARDYGITRRRVEVLKIRASSFREGYHDFVIVRGGLRVFPRLISGEHRNVRVGQLAATMAHEVNNPLEALTNLLFLVEMSNNVEEARSFGHLAAQELGRISEIVNQTLRFHRAPAKPAF